MARPPALSSEQIAQARLRRAAGEGVRALATEYGVSPSVMHRAVGEQTERIRNVAIQIADSRAALAELPLAHQQTALSLAEKLRNISMSLAAAGELGAKTAHRLQHLANAEVVRVDDADPMASIENLRNVGVLTKLANDSASIAINLLAANRPTVERINSEQPAAPGIDAKRLSSATLAELMAARDAAIG